jgi:hypothetical protein
MKRFAKLLSFFLTVAIVASSGWALLNRQVIYDWMRLRDYSPTLEIAQLAEQTTMSDKGRKLFYTQHPELDDRDAFSQHCSGFGEQTIVLGCYISNQGIYLFDIQDQRLDGVEQVTAAHEMLHAAYDRLGSKERQHVDQLTQRVADSLADERIKNTIASYRQRDPNVVPNELHSIVGTEVRSLPPELETYYKKYFTNRAQIVTFAEQYEGALTERRNKADALELEINGLKAEIDVLEKTLAQQKEDLDRDRPAITTQAEANAYNGRVAAYNAHIRELNNLINQHNQKVDEYKANAVEQQELYKSLDSRPTL